MILSIVETKLIITHKICTKCSIEKSVTEFAKDAQKIDGLTSRCKLCIITHRNDEYNIEYQRKLRLSNPEKTKDNKRNSYRYREISKKLFLQCKNRALRRGHEFDLKLEDIIVPEKCPLLECEFIIGTMEDYEYTHSLDRIDNTKGYVSGNIQVISKKANSMKNSASKQELINFAKNILKIYGNDDIV